MGRKPSRWANLPKGMRARPRGNLIHYYLDTGKKPRKEIPLGSDYVQAVKKWAELTAGKPPEGSEVTFATVKKAYWKDVIPGKAPQTQLDNEKEIANLMAFFDSNPAPLDLIEPTHINMYLRWRVIQAREAAERKNEERAKAGRPTIPVPQKIGQVRANREKALFSHIWNYARAHGYTKLPNPCTGIKGFTESGRDTYVGDELMERVMEKAGKPLQFALRLAHLTGQRPSDVLRMSTAHINDGVLNVRQGKTKAKLRIVIEGELASLLDEIKAFKERLKVHAITLLVNEDGEPLTPAMLRNRFDDARAAAGIDKADFQFRDLRAKAATEADDATGTKSAQSLLGHTTEGMTASYIRHKAGKKVRLAK